MKVNVLNVSYEQFYKSHITTIFFVSPHRVLKILEFLNEIYGSDQEIFIGRELTKLYETIYKERLQDLLIKFKYEKIILKVSLLLL